MGLIATKFITAIPGYWYRRDDQQMSCVTTGYEGHVVLNMNRILSPVFAGNGCAQKY